MSTINSVTRGHLNVDKLRAYFDLTKPRINLLILIVAVASFWVASHAALNWLRLFEMIVGVGMLGAGIFALNHYAERDTDTLMRRTDRRPIPSKRLSAREALWFGSTLTALSILFITAVMGWLAGALAVFTFVAYIFVYTPLKRHTAYHTALGALPGAMPPLIGWAAARGSLDLDAWLLFGVLFFWQFPHFLSIEMMYSEDYARAGIKVLPVIEPSWQATGVEILVSLVLLAVFSILPYFTGLVGSLYLVGAVLSDAAFLAAGIVSLIRRERTSARLVLLASVFYLPVLFGLMVLDVK